MVTPVKHVFGMPRCGFPFDAFTRRRQKDGMMGKNIEEKRFRNVME